MTNTGNDLFLLMVNLSQYRSKKNILRVFTESMDEMYPHLGFSFSEQKNDEGNWYADIQTADYQFGFLCASEEPSEDEKAEIQNAVQMVGIILQNIKQQELLGDEKTHLEELVNKRTREVRESEEKYRTLFETMAQGVVYQDSNGHIISANNAAEEILGLSFSQMQGRTTRDPRWKAISEDGNELEGDKHPAMIALRTGKQIENFIQGIYNPKKNDYVWIIVNSIPQFREGETKPYQVFSTFLDVTQLKNTEDRLKNIVEHSTNLFYTHAPDYTLTYLSPRTYEFFDCSPEEAKNTPWTEFITNNPVNDKGRNLTDKAIETGQRQKPYELELKTKKGRIVWVEVHEAPIVDEGKTVSIVGALVDITERKKNEEKIKNQNKKYKQLYNELKKYSEQLQKSNELIAQKEQHFRLLVDNAPDAIFIQTNWKFQYVNKKALELFGAKNSEQLIGKPILNRFHPDFHEQIKERIKGLNEEKEKQDQAELVCIKLDGTETDVETSGIPFTYYNQDGALVFARDITDRKKAEETLKESQERFKALFYENSSVLIIVDPDTGNIYDVNNKAVEFYGYSKEEMRSMNVQKLNILPDRQVKEEMEKAIKGEKNYFNFPHRLANGEIKDVEIYTGKIYIEGKAYIYSTIHDITEDTRNRMRLQKGEEIAGIGHWEYDLNSGNVYASEGAKKIYGLHKSNLTIQEVQQIPLKEYRPMMDNALERLVKDGEPYDIEFQIKRPTDQKIVDIHSIGEYNPERNVVFGIIQDISERKRFEKELQSKNEELQAAEEELRVSNEELRDTNQRLEEQKQELEEAKEKAEESDRLKSAFLANMSHEIRTPMNGIMGFSQVLLESDFSEKKRNKFLKIIHSRSRHLLQIINDIVDISKIEANQFDIHTEEFCLNDMLHELYETYQTDKISYGKEHLDIQLEKGLNKRKSYINSDVKRLRQILTNLIGNALKFTEKGKIKFGYTLHNEQTLLFYVSDTGIGISQKNQGYIFERFRQLDDSSNRLNEGTGLGLTISKNLSELLGGSMWMESTEGKGSTFYFTIPYNKQKTEKMEDKSRDQKGYKWKGKKILVIEDDPTSQEFIKEVLRPTEAELIFSETGEKGLQKYEEQDIDLILMDIRLPGKNGIEITRKIRQKDGDIRIIAQTAYAMSEDRKKCMDAGANDYISKPIDPDDLMTIMNQHV